MMRSVVTYELLKEHDAVLWWDSDVVARNPMAVLRVCDELQHAPHVSVGVYPQKGGQDGLATFGLPDVFDVPSPVEGSGAGCMLIPRVVAEATGQHLPELEDKRGRVYRPIFHKLIHGRAELGEDISFCARAREAGFQVMAIPEFGDLGHVRECGEIDWSSKWLP
jgi:hypothetical protein